jgi:nucleoside-diphosphate-sugar epimerase
VGRGSDEVCPVHVDDIVAALVAALDTPAAAGKLYTLGGDCMSIRTFAARCAQAFGTKNRLLPVPIPVVALLSAASRILPLPLYPDQLQRLRAPKDIPGREAARDLGFAPRLLEDGLREIRKPR